MSLEPKPRESNDHRGPRTHHSSWVCSVVDPGKCMDLAGPIWCPSHFFPPFFGDPLPFQLVYSVESVMRPEYFTFDDVSVWGLSFLSVSQCSSLFSVGTLLICPNFLSPSLWAFGLSNTIRMPSLLAQRCGFYKNIDDDHCKHMSVCEQPLQ